MKFLNYGVPTTSVVLSRTLVRASFNLDRKQTKRDEDEFVRRTAVEELARGWKDDPDALPWLKDRAAREENELVRSVAVQELAWAEGPARRSRPQRLKTPMLRRQQGDPKPLGVPSTRQGVARQTTPRSRINPLLRELH
jgi:hypothetical protein